MPTLAEDQATIVSLRGILNSGATQIAQSGRMVRLDLATVRQQLGEAEARVAAQMSCPPRTRRLLTIQCTKGY